MPDGAGAEPQIRFRLNGVALAADPSGAVWWPAQRTLIVADLHLEKGSGFAARGRLLPPYDTRTTLARLAEAIARLQPARVVCLGDTFHDGAAGERLAAADEATLSGLVAGRDWIWIAGNHDPAPPRRWGGEVRDELTIDALTLRHEARPGARGELSGHFHPKAVIRTRHRRIAGRCFVTDGHRLVLPAFGAYAGGLDVLAPAIAGLFGRRFTVFLMAGDRLYPFPRDRLSPIG